MSSTAHHDTESVVIQRLKQRSDYKRNTVLSNDKRKEETAVILSAINAEIFASNTQTIPNETANDADINFYGNFPWNLPLSLTKGHIFVGKSLAAACVSPNKYSKKKVSSNNQDGITDRFMRNTVKSGHICQKTDYFSNSSQNERSVNKTGNTDFSDCFCCNAMLIEDDLSEWKKKVGTLSECSKTESVSCGDADINANNLERVDASVQGNKFVTDYLLPPSARCMTTKQSEHSKTPKTKGFKSPLMASSPKLRKSKKTEYFNIPQTPEGQGSGNSTDSLSTISNEHNHSATFSLSEECCKLESFVLRQAQIVEVDYKEENVAQLSEVVPYNIDHFLKDALGEEMDISSSTDVHDASIQITEMQGDCPVGLEGQLFHTVSGYRTLTEFNKQKERPNLLTSIKMSVPETHASVGDKDVQAAVQSLFSEAKVQTSIIIQASKAIAVCSASKNFTSSHERVEYERLLLLSTHKRNAAYEEIHRLKFEGIDDTGKCLEKGTIQITELSVKVKENFQKYGVSDAAREETWFVCLLSYHDKVLATEAVADTKQGSIDFSGCYSFSGLPKDFTIKLQVFSLKQRIQISGHQSNHLPKVSKMILACPIPCKKVKNSTTKLTSGSCEKLVQTSSFLLAGEFNLQLHDVHLCKPWPLHKLPLSSPLFGIIDMNLKTSLTLTAEYSGFLNLFEVSINTGFWQKYWFYLKDNSLKYWNYPSDKDEKDPVAEIDLSKCLSKTIGSADRTLCARPRTFVIEINTKQTTSETLRYFLSADTGLEMTQWCCVLNKVVKSLRDWNIIKVDF